MLHTTTKVGESSITIFASVRLLASVLKDELNHITFSAMKSFLK